MAAAPAAGGAPAGAAEAAAAVRDIAAGLAAKQRAVRKVHDCLPKRGWQQGSVMRLARELAALNDDPTDGRFSGCVYHDFRNGYTEFMNAVMGLFQWTNPLHGGNFAGVGRMEAEMISMTVNMFKGGAKHPGAEQACGAMTSGGTESIMLAMLAYREHARERGITNPELVVPVTAHAAFDKAAHYFGLTIRHASLDKDTCKVDMEHMKSLITENTICLVGSAPNFPHGIIDYIPGIAELGLQRTPPIPVHVDACLGGFLVAFMKEAGYELPHPVDFTLPGVTSISCDTHKYGFACKGSSVIMYREPKWRRLQMYITPDWPGGLYATVTLAGSRPGNLVAGSWAAMMTHGEDGYISTTTTVISTARWIAAKCAEIPGLKVVGEPLVSVIALRSDEFDIYRLQELLGSRHWELNALQFPRSIHLCVTLMHATKDSQGRSHAERFIKDCQWAAERCRNNPNQKATGMAALYGSSQMLADRTSVADVLCAYHEAYYSLELQRNYAKEAGSAPAPKRRAKQAAPAAKRPRKK